MEFIGNHQGVTPVSHCDKTAVSLPNISQLVRKYYQFQNFQLKSAHNYVVIGVAAQS